MLETTIEEKQKRDDLRAERNQLFERYLRHPTDIRLALQIKALDDQLAEVTESTTARNRASLTRRPK